MKTLVINSSPKGARSDCLKLTKAFVKGLETDAEILHAAELTIRPCTGCYTCWRATPGVCVHHDDMPEVLEKLPPPIWSFGPPRFIATACPPWAKPSLTACCP